MTCLHARRITAYLATFCQAARAAYTRGLLALHVSIVKLGQMANEAPSLADLPSSPTFRGLFSLLERFTQLLTFDLLAPESVSLRHVFADLEDGDAEVSGVASLVEYQYRYLASSPASRSGAARTAMNYLIADAVVFYQADRFPIRRARFVPQSWITEFANYCPLQSTHKTAGADVL